MTTNSTDFEEAIKSRFEQGFNEWNGGYEGWLNWCNTLYEPDAHYNIYSNRLTLQQYKDMMGQLFSAYDVELGEFHNMIIDGDWGAIRYSVHIINKHTGENIEQQTMEFVHFKDNPEPIGARVIEGWALSDTPLSAGQPACAPAFARAQTSKERAGYRADRKAKIRARMAADGISYTRAALPAGRKAGQAPTRAIDCATSTRRTASGSKPMTT